MKRGNNMDNIYEIFNDAKVDFNEYNTYELSPIEKKRMKKEISKKLKMNSYKNKKNGAIVAAAILAITFTSTAVLPNSAFAKVFGTSIEELIHHKDGSLQEYKSVINKEVTQNGVSGKLNEVVLDDGQILISSTFKSNKIKWDESSLVVPKIYINGNLVSNGGGSCKATKLNDTTCNFLSSVTLKDLKNLSGNLDFKVEYDKIFAKDGVEGNWTYKFASNKDKLVLVEKTIPINKNIAYDGDKKISIDNLKISPISTTLNFTMLNYEKTYYNRNHSIEFIVKDQDGKDLHWTSGNTMVENSFWKYDTLDKSITKLKITPVFVDFGQPTKVDENSYSYDSKNEIRKVLDDQSFEIKIK